MTNSAEIFDGVLEYAISEHMELMEEKDVLLKKFDGDKIKLVQWLRDRAFSKNHAVASNEVIVEEPKKETPASLIPKKAKRVNKKKVTPEDIEGKNQNSIF